MTASMETPAARAAEVVNHLLSPHASGALRDRFVRIVGEAIMAAVVNERAAIRAAIRAAVAAERERCAKFVDEWFAPIGIVECARMKKALAAALRVRSRP